MNQKIPLIATTTAILFTMALQYYQRWLACQKLVVVLFGNPYQEKCGETKTHCTSEVGCVITAPEDRETHTPSAPVRIP